MGRSHAPKPVKFVMNSRINVTDFVATTPEPVRAPLLSVRFQTDVSGLEDLRDAWIALERAPADHDAPFFQSYAWCAHVAQVRAMSARSDYRLLIATLHDELELVGIWPLSLQKQSGLWIVRSLDDPFGQFAGILCRHADWIEVAMRAVVQAVRDQHLADAICLDNIVEGSPLHCALISMGARSGSSNATVRVDMRMAPTFSEYQKTLNAKTRKNLRNAMNRLERHGSVKHRVIDDPTHLAAVASTTFAGRMDWVRLHGKSTGAFRDPDFRQVLETASAAPDLQLLGFELHAGNDLVASQWGFVYQGRYYAYMSARDRDHDQFSPGRLHLGRVIEACKARGIDVLELMAPASRYKLMWSDCVTGVHNLWLPLTVRARVVWGLREIASPMAHAAARLLPSSLKRRLARWINAE
jgi:CelD/BcsL family acetyltransferase involved in cellulose biosynthesis